MLKSAPLAVVNLDVWVLFFLPDSTVMQPWLQASHQLAFGRGWTKCHRKCMIGCSNVFTILLMHWFLSDSHTEKLESSPVVCSCIRVFTDIAVVMSEYVTMYGPILWYLRMLMESRTIGTLVYICGLSDAPHSLSAVSYYWSLGCSHSLLWQQLQCSVISCNGSLH